MRNGFVVPVVVWVAVHGGEQTRGQHVQVLGAISTGLEDEHGHLRVFGKAGCDGQAGSAAADDTAGQACQQPVSVSERSDLHVVVCLGHDVRNAGQHDAQRERFPDHA